MVVNLVTVEGSLRIAVTDEKLTDRINQQVRGPFGSCRRRTHCSQLLAKVEVAEIDLIGDSHQIILRDAALAPLLHGFKPVLMESASFLKQHSRASC